MPHLPVSMSLEYSVISFCNLSFNSSTIFRSSLYSIINYEIEKNISDSNNQIVTTGNPANMVPQKNEVPSTNVKVP